MVAFSHSLEQVLSRAMGLAGECLCGYVTLDHLLLALIEDDEVLDVLRACDVDPDLFRRNLAEHVDAEAAPSTVPQVTVPTGEFERIVRESVILVQSARVQEPPLSTTARILSIVRSLVRKPHEPLVGPKDVLVALMTDKPASEAARRLEQAGLTQYDALRFIAHRFAKGDVDDHKADPELLPEGATDVMILNDDYTPTDLVADVLERFFRKSREESIAITLTIHANGSTVVGTYPDRRSALAKAEQVTTFVRGLHLPLRCVVAHSRFEREGAHAELLT